MNSALHALEPSFLKCAHAAVLETPSIRNKGSPVTSAGLVASRGTSPGTPVQETSLVRLRLTHDLIGGEADVAIWKGIPNEVVGEVRIVVLAFLHVWKLDIGDR